jgi:DNA polymerase-4
VERTFGDFITGLETASEKVKLLYEELYSEILYKDKYNFTSGIFVKIKFSDFSVTTVSKTGPSPSFESFFGLLEKGIRRNSNPIRLLGLGVRLHSIINKISQLEFIDFLDPINLDHP